jgi:HPt (histidine-containing phosphotransfer) domain-containing protein
MKTAASLRLVDLADMRRRLEDDEQLIADLLVLFLQELPAQLETLRSAVARCDPDAVRRAAHVLKSSVGNLSASEATRAAATLEHAAARRQSADFDTQFAAVVAHLNALADELRAFLGVQQ